MKPQTASSTRLLVLITVVLAVLPSYVRCFSVPSGSNNLAVRRLKCSPTRSSSIRASTSASVLDDEAMPSLKSGSSDDSNDDDDDDIVNSNNNLNVSSDSKSVLASVQRGGGSSAFESPPSSTISSTATVTVWPCLDELDRKLIKLAVPSIANFAINPLIGAVDLFWVGRMGNALALAGMAAANQVFNSAFWLFSFLPTITAPLVSKAHARGDKEEVQDLICQAMMLGVFVSAGMSVLMLHKPELFLSAVLEKGAPATEFAKPYLMVRALSFLPAMVATVGFSAFRGRLIRNHMSYFFVYL